MPASRPLGADYWRFWSAAAVSNLGDGIRLGALPLLALRLTDDPVLIALATAATMLPWFVLGPVVGAVVDRVDRRRLMWVGQGARATLVAFLAVLVALDTATIWWLLVVAFAIGAGEVVVDTSSQAAIPRLVDADQLERANGRLIAAMTVLDQVVGVALGSVLFAVASPLPFAVDAATFAVAAMVLLTVRRPLQDDRTATSGSTSVRADIVAGMRYLVGHRLLRAMVGAVATTNLAGNVSMGVLVILVVDELGAAEASYGVVLGIGAIGGVLGSFAADRIVAAIGRRRVLALAHAPLVVGLLLNAVANHVAIVAIAFGLGSFAVVVFNVPAQSLRQTIVPDQLLGRVVAGFRIFGMAAAPVGAVIGGAVTGAAEVRTAMLVAAGSMGVAWLLMLRALTHLPEEGA